MGGESFCPYRATGVRLPLPRAIALGYEGLPFQGDFPGLGGADLYLSLRSVTVGSGRMDEGGLGFCLLHQG